MEYDKDTHIALDLKEILNDTGNRLSHHTIHFLGTEIMNRTIHPKDIEFLLKDIPIDISIFHTNKVYWIKWIRAKTALGLKESKNLFDNIVEHKI